MSLPRGRPLAETEIVLYIVFNGSLEAIVVPMAVLLTWDDRRRRVRDPLNGWRGPVIGKLLLEG